MLRFNILNAYYMEPLSCVNYGILGHLGTDIIPHYPVDRSHNCQAHIRIQLHFIPVSIIQKKKVFSQFPLFYLCPGIRIPEHTPCPSRPAVAILVWAQPSNQYKSHIFCTVFGLWPFDSFSPVASIEFSFSAHRRLFDCEQASFDIQCRLELECKTAKNTDVNFQKWIGGRGCTTKCRVWGSNQRAGGGRYLVWTDSWTNYLNNFLSIPWVRVRYWHRILFQPEEEYSLWTISAFLAKSLHIAVAVDGCGWNFMNMAT